MSKVVTIICLLGCLLLAACSQHYLQSESGLYDVMLNKHLKSPVDGVWTWGNGNPYQMQSNGLIYIAPLEVDLVVHEEPSAVLMQAQMHDYMVQSFVEMLKEANKANNTHWQLTFDPAQAHIRIDTALVRFKPQRHGFRVVAETLRFLDPFPGSGTVAGKFAKGDITIEATIRDCKSGQLLLAFKDSNRKTTKLYQAAAYSKTGNADVNLRSWAKVLAHICRVVWYDQSKGATLQEKFDDYTYAEALRDRFLY